MPLLMAGKGGIPQGKRVGALVSLLDMFPTFGEVSKVQLETDVDGRSLLPLLDGREDGRERQVVCEYLGEGALEPMRMIRAGAHKYISINGNGPQLFDLEKDPQETVNLAGRNDAAGVEKVLRARAESGWDGAALKKAVLRSQQERALVQSCRKLGVAPRWDLDAVIPGAYGRAL